MEIDEQTLHALKSRAKAGIRRRIVALRRALPATAIERRSHAIVERVRTMDAYTRARGVAFFWPIEGRGEVDLRSLDARARAEGKRVYYPFQGRGDDPGSVGFARVDSPRDLEPRGHGFSEPPDGAPAAGDEDLDVIFVPAVAASVDGHRIGHGSGFYDRVLAAHGASARTVAVVFDFQLMGELPSEPHDRACDFVVTDDRLIEVGQPR